MSSLPTQCSKKVNGCFCDNVYVKNTIYTDLIQPKTVGGTVSIPSLVVPPPVIDCLTLSASQTIVGCGADGSDGANNTAVGVNALSVVTGNDNTSIGYESAKGLSSGSLNVVVGSFAGTAMESATGNVIIGESTGVVLTTGLENILVGLEAGLAIEDGNNNTIIGSNSGKTIVDGINNVIIGNIAGENTSTDLSGTVLIGNNAGGNNTTNNRLMIDNTNTDEPLIDGDFSGNTLQVNGTITLGTDSTTPVHVLNVSEVPLTLENDAGYIRLNINGTIKRIKLYDDVNPP